MLIHLFLWGALLVGLVTLIIDKQRGIGGLTLGYFLALSLGHVPGVLVYLDPSTVAEATKVGFEVTLLGMTSFIVGTLAARISARHGNTHPQMIGDDEFSRLSWRVTTIGIVCYFVILPVSSLVPSLTAITSGFGTLLILGFWLQVYAAATASYGQQKPLLLIMLPLIPMATLLNEGFLSYGTVWLLSILAFYFVVTRRRIWFYLATLPVIFMGLSLFVTYFDQREDIREVIWFENSGIIQRVERVSKLVTDFQLLDLSNPSHLFALDQRLNQNQLVGIGVMRHRGGEVELLYGGTVPLWALIPRAIWPDKPAVGGGNNLVTEFTAIEFDEDTSVGSGQVLEFYFNFGMSGVLIGFAILGFILMRLDQMSMRALAVGNFYGMVRSVLPGLALLAPLGNLLEILVSVVSAVITAQLLVRSKLLSLPPQDAEIHRQTLPVVGQR